MDGRCETCKWWRFPEEREAPQIDEGDPYYGVCELISDIESETARAFVANPPGDTSYHKPGHVLWTGKDFGCVQWEAKGDD